MQHRLATPVGRIPGSDRLHTRPWNKPEQNVSKPGILIDRCATPIRCCWNLGLSLSAVSAHLVPMARCR
jgi:hypothetical protein